MKKYLITFLVMFMVAFEIVQAQDIFVPHFRFRCDNNPADRAFLTSPAQLAGGWRYADNDNMLQYHFKLSDFESINSEHPLYLRFFVWNEFVVKVSDIPITSVNEGELLAQYSDDPANNPEHNGTNQQWIDVPLQEYYDFGWDDFYVSVFDGRPEDGWGPSVPEIGFYYYENTANIPDNNVKVALGDVDYITADGNMDEWSSDNTWINIAKDAQNIVTTGAINDNNDLSATASVAFDKENVYFAADVTDDEVVIDGDKVVFYFGLYSLDKEQTQFGHRALNDLSGYRNRREPDYRVVVDVNESLPIVTETNIVGGEVSDAVVSVVKTSNGYKVEAKIPFYALFVQDSVSNMFSIDPTPFPGIWNIDNVEIPYIPFAFKIEDYDASAMQGSLITGTDSDVDVSPSSWAFKTDMTDIRTEGEAETPKGILKVINVVTEDELYLVPQYTGSGAGTSHRWADNSDTLAYHFNLADLESIAPGVNLYLDFHVWSEYVIDISGSLTGEKQNLAVWSSKGLPVHDGSNPTDVELSLKDLRDLGYEEVYVWLTDGLPETGWGPSINRIRLYYTGDYSSQELASFTPGTKEGDNDAAYLVADNNSSGRDSHRYTDNDQSFGYKINLAEFQAQQPADKNTELFFNVYIRGQYVITVAQDENTPREEQDTVAIWSTVGLNLTDGSNIHWEEQSLQPYIDAGWQNVVFFYYDGLPENGWGADLWGATITYRELLANYYFDEFIPGPAGTSESKYIVSDRVGSGNDDNHRWADGTSQIVYKLNKTELVAASGGYDNIVFQVDVANEFIISVAKDLDSVKTELYLWSDKGLQLRDESNREVRDIQLKEYFDLGWEDVYVFFEDGRPEDGWGPSLRWVGLSTLRSVVTDVETVDNVIPTEFALNQNYPNPFNPETIISYSLPEHSSVTLKVYDLLGREIKTLINETQNAGNYRITWKGDNNFGSKVASGVYFYRMMYNNKMQLVKKMLLLR